MSLKANEQSVTNPGLLNPSWQAITQGVIQNISYTATHAESAAFGAGTTLVRLVATSDCYFLCGTAPVATTSNGTLLPSGAIEYFGVTPGQKISFIQSSAGGACNITEAKG